VRNEPIVVPVHGQLARVNHPLAPVTAAFDRRLGPTRALTRAVLPFASQVRILDNLGPDVIADVWLSTEKTAVSSRRLTSLALSDLQAPDEGESAGPHAAMVGLQGVFPTAFVQGPPPLPGGAPPPAPAGQSAPTRMLVAGSADMVANNVDLVLNGLDWLLSDPRLVSIRGRTAAPEPMAAPQPDRATTLKLAMGGSPLLLLALLGALVGWRNRRDH
jgi:hypothetical protein